MHTLQHKRRIILLPWLASLLAALSLLNQSCSGDIANDDGDNATQRGQLASERAPGAGGITPAPIGTGIWISREEILNLPSSGAAWDNVKQSCDVIASDPGLNAPVGGHTSNHDVRTLACAFVAVRLSSTDYFQKTVNNLIAAVGSETSCGGDTCNSLSLHRNLASYAMAADLIAFPTLGLSAYGQTETYFRNWLERMLTYDHPAGDGCSGSNCDAISKHEQMMNNHGSVAGASRMAIDLYLGDMVDFERAAKVFKGFMGDRASWVFTRAVGTLDWQANSAEPVPINPAGATKVYNGVRHSIDGAMPSEMQRGGAFQFPPVHTGYPWAALYGEVVQAEILHRQGHDAYNWGDQALRRAVKFLYDLDQAYGGWWNYWSGVANVQWIINHRYGTDFPTEATAPTSNIIGADWTHP